MTDQPPSVAGVRFRNAGKIFYCDAAGHRLEPGEYVVVESGRGPEVARVVIAPGQVLVSDFGGEHLAPVLRMAGEDDILKAEELRTRALEHLQEARRLARDAGFPAHLDSAELTLDGRRLTLSFTSEERLDYRDFVRRAASHFRLKIEMRQVGARDRARAAGGFGVCGRELCCSTWLTSFPSISIRMAKEQELPLNPQKISGLCGRLLCCLSYEEDGYREMRRTLPRVGQRCSTPAGEGKVLSVNILRRQVTILVEGQRVEVGDPDLGLTVRWDPGARNATPPPSLSRAEAIAQGLLDPAAAAEDDLDALSAPEGPAWLSVAGNGRDAPGARGRTGRPPAATRPPGPRPQPGPEPVKQRSASRPEPRAQGRGSEPRGPGGGPRGPRSQPPPPSGPGGVSRPFARAQPPADSGHGVAPGEDEARAASRRRRRGRRGGGETPPGSPPPAG